MRAHVLTLGTIACLTSLFTVACGGDKSGDRSEGSGGSSGSSGNTGGMSAGGQGAHDPYQCVAQKVTAPDMLATIDSNGKWGASANLNGGAFKYVDADMKSSFSSVAYSTGQIAVKGHIAAYSGVGLWFGTFGTQPAPCADASDYQGVSFEVVNNGTETPNIKLALQVHDDAPIDKTNTRGGCAWDSEATRYTMCAYPGAEVTLPTDGSAIQVPWSMFAGGAPVADAQGGTKLDGLQFEFWKEGATPYDIDIILKNIKFY